MIDPTADAELVTPPQIRDWRKSDAQQIHERPLSHNRWSSFLISYMRAGNSSSKNWHTSFECKEDTPSVRRTSTGLLQNRLCTHH